MRRKIVVLFVCFASAFGAVACGREVELKQDAKEEVEEAQEEVKEAKEELKEAKEAVKKAEQKVKEEQQENEQK